MLIDYRQNMHFKDRKEAGAKLAEALLKYKKAPKTKVIGLPRGGVVVASVVARALQLPLDVIVPRKIGAPENEELAIGALAGDVVLLNRELIELLNISPAAIEKIIEKEKKEAQRRTSLFQSKKTDLEGWTLLLVDDGIATGYTMRASIAYLKKKKAGRIVVAIPVGPTDTIEELKKEADETICLYSPSNFLAVGQFYEHFEQVEDPEVIRLLHE